MKRRILALVAALMLMAGGALAELVEGQQPNWLVAKIGEDYSKVGEVSQPEGFRRVSGTGTCFLPVRYCPVSEAGLAMTSSGVPAATICPPFAPAPGPMSTR